MTAVTQRIACCKVSEHIPLEQFCSSNRKQSTGTTRLVLPEPLLEDIHKRKANGRKVWIYSYGCLVLYGFSEAEEREFITSFTALLLGATNEVVLRYYESVTMEEDGNLSGLSALSEVLARSIFLYWASDRIAELLDGADIMLTHMRQGRINLRSRRLRTLISESLRFESRFSGYFGALGRDIGADEREIFLRLSARYELHERLAVASMKLGILDGILKSYNDTVYSRDENRLLRFEIVLLILFPLLSLYHMLPKVDFSILSNWVTVLFK